MGSSQWLMVAHRQLREPAKHRSEPNVAQLGQHASHCQLGSARMLADSGSWLELKLSRSHHNTNQAQYIQSFLVASSHFQSLLVISSHSSQICVFLICSVLPHVPLHYPFHSNISAPPLSSCLAPIHVSSPLFVQSPFTSHFLHTCIICTKFHTLWLCVYFTLCNCLHTFRCFSSFPLLLCISQ